MQALLENKMCTPNNLISKFTWKRKCTLMKGFILKEQIPIHIVKM